MRNPGRIQPRSQGDAKSPVDSALVILVAFWSPRARRSGLLRCGMFLGLRGRRFVRADHWAHPDTTSHSHPTPLPVSCALGWNYGEIASKFVQVTGNRVAIPTFPLESARQKGPQSMWLTAKGCHPGTHHPTPVLAHRYAPLVPISYPQLQPVVAPCLNRTSATIQGRIVLAAGGQLGPKMNSRKLLATHVQRGAD